VTGGIIETGDRVVRFYSRPWFKPVIGVFLLTVILTAGPLYGRFTAGGKIDPAISRDAAVVSVVVDLVVDPTTFHRTELQELGVFSGRDRNNPTDRSRVRLQNVTQENLDKLSRKYWVVRIEPA
jgi:hypothetical protein